MVQSNGLKIFIIIITIIIVFSFACSNSDNKKNNNEPKNATYIGNSSCKDCHKAIYNNFVKSGHNFIQNRINYGNPQIYPYSEIPKPPAEYAWDDILYVIGGYGWKAIFINKKGYIITGDSAQYNLETGAFTSYFSEYTEKKYDCGNCHTTGYKNDGTFDNLPGISGSWAEDNITCERCHGKASLHAEKPDEFKLTKNGSIESCGECHSRNNGKNIKVQEGFISNHQQYEEILAGAHHNYDCITCHDPHISTKYSTKESIKKPCGDCHPDKKINIDKMSALSCKICHMPYAGKSAIKKNNYEGDLRTHIFIINVDSTANMFYDSGGNTYSHGFLTLDFVCLRCHLNKTRQWASSTSINIHQ
ncbi:MAG: hypothetical protein HY934_06130 [Candidatus Firestonebacteria bacterium]|nr:hypothetical protein [Candidatus Firestonebacteria bacterium]